MGRLFVLIGKSASGKDAVYQTLLEDPDLGLKAYVGYTTRPIRDGEENGREYFFSTAQELAQYEAAGKLIEKRVYHTVHGDWIYFSVDHAGVDLNRDSYLYIGTLESYIPLRDHYGRDKVIPIYLQVEDGIRLQRALDREKAQKTPRYAEMCRRFLSDTEDFSETHLQEADIQKRFENRGLPECIAEIRAYIEQQMASV